VHLPVTPTVDGHIHPYLAAHRGISLLFDEPAAVLIGDALQGLPPTLNGSEVRAPLGVGPGERIVDEVYFGGRNVNLKLVRLGLAYAYPYWAYLSDFDATAYFDAEGQAEHYWQGVRRWGKEEKPWEFWRK